MKVKSKVLERRRVCLEHARSISHEKGYFTIKDIVNRTGMPRSTVQDWINRLVEEGCVKLIRERDGPIPAKYVSITRTFPASSCRRIFTTVEDDLIEIFHACRSEGCLEFCEWAHGGAGGVVRHVKKEGMLLHEIVEVGKKEIDLKRYSVGVMDVYVKDGIVYQRIASRGGPAYSLTEMMQFAEGVIEVRVEDHPDYTVGTILTEALEHLTIAVDDTDRGDRGATFALTLGLLNVLSTLPGVFPISHKVAFLKPDIPHRTVGNSVSFIELAIKPQILDTVIEESVRYLKSETLSDETGMAYRIGFKENADLRAFAAKARREEVSVEDAMRVAELANVGVLEVTGRRGIIGAVAALGLSGLPSELLFDPGAAFP
ncbi:MAG: Transcriptional regulator TrmB [Candidatus Syntrophoarchaeum caldarius]|uniref:Transcriptional regulator TrmB n=1 Tax=Candidatus Syntropharchaeum caldarium TaxID=1838285 RepID=A0A1F2PAV1_9EURY|nr:MAG: Transcriptional regulator TrmB [Candidatus Syntrophoarchaeum caldarius]